MPRVSVAVALPGRQEVFELDLAPGSTLGDAVAAANLRERFPELDWTQAKAGIWSRTASEATRLRDGDRVEIYRNLKADPKDTRRARARLRTSTRSRSGP